MNYIPKLLILNLLIQVVIEFNNKFYKFSIEIHDHNPDSKAKFYYEYTYYCNKRPRTNGRPNNYFKNTSKKKPISIIQKS